YPPPPGWPPVPPNHCPLKQEEPHETSRSSRSRCDVVLRRRGFGAGQQHERTASGAETTPLHARSTLRPVIAAKPFDELRFRARCDPDAAAPAAWYHCSTSISWTCIFVCCTNQRASRCHLIPGCERVAISARRCQ